MKKIFTLVLGLSAMTAAYAAPTVELLFRGEPVVDGATYTAGYTEEVPGMIFLQKTQLDLRGPVGAEVTLSTVGEDSYEVCWPVSCVNINGGGDYSVSGNLGANSGQPAGTVVTESTMIEVTTIGKVDQLKPNVITVTMTPTATPEDKVTVTVNLVLQPDDEVASIQDIYLPQDNLPAEYFDLQGRTVREPRAGNLYIVRDAQGARTIMMR